MSGMNDIPEDRVADADDDGDRDSQGTAIGKAATNGKSKKKENGARDEIAAQDRAVLAMFKDANQAKVDRCVNILSKSLERLWVRYELYNHII